MVRCNQPKPRPIKFSVGTLLMLTTTVALGVAWWLERREHTKTRIEQSGYQSRLEELEAEEIGFLLCLKRCSAQSRKPIATASDQGSPQGTGAARRSLIPQLSHLARTQSASMMRREIQFQLFTIQTASHTAVSQTEEDPENGIVVESCQRLGKNGDMVGHAFK